MGSCFVVVPLMGSKAWCLLCRGWVTRFFHFAFVSHPLLGEVLCLSKPEDPNGWLFL
jgi:hypothetical protein